MHVWIVDAFYKGFVLPLAWAASTVASWFSPKWSTWKREGKLALQEASSVPNSGPRIWIHASSMGEFEQISPIVASLRVSRPDITVIATITSPSGLEHAQNSPLLDAALLLPLDRRSSMRRLVAAIHPDLVLIDRYDLWRNMIVALSARNTPMLLVNATFPSVAKTWFLRRWVRDTYARLSFIGAVTETEAALFSELAPDVESSRVPDTRLEQVISRVQTVSPQTSLLRSTKKSIVLGSTWPADEQLFATALSPELRQQLRLIVVPHVPHASTVERLCSEFNAVRWSQVSEPTDQDVVVDEMGILADLYGSAGAAYVGGGFGVGVHSTTEPAVHGIPVATGPNITRSADAVDLASRGMLTVVHDASGLQHWLEHVVLNEEACSAVQVKCESFIIDCQGGTEIYAAIALAWLND